VKKEDAPKGLTPAEALDEAQANVKVPEEQELPDHTIQTKEELEQTIAEIDEKRANGARPQDVPDGHPAVGEASAEGGAGACPFMAGGSS